MIDNEKENDNLSEANLPEELDLPEVPAPTQFKEPSEAEPTPMDEYEEPAQLQPEAVYESTEIHPQKLSKPKPSKFKRTMRNILIVLAVALLVFLGGYLTNYFTALKPATDTLNATKAELELATGKIAELEAENKEITKAKLQAQDDVTTLEAQLEANQINIMFNQVLLDVNAARIALFMDDLDTAKTALDDTKAHLEELLPAIEKADSDLALSLPIRLELIITGIPRNPDIGEIDLEIFTRDLMDLKPLLGLD